MRHIPARHPLASLLLAFALVAAGLTLLPALPAAAAEGPAPGTMGAAPAGWAQHGGGLSSTFRGPRLVVDWTTADLGPSHSVQGPVHVRLLTADGRFLAQRRARRSAQGWIASLRVAGWPAGTYRVEAQAGAAGPRTQAYLTLP